MVWSEGAFMRDPVVAVRHVFTHFGLTLAIEKRNEPPAGDGWWQPLDAIGEAGLPTLYKKVVAEMALVS